MFGFVADIDPIELNKILKVKDSEIYILPLTEKPERQSVNYNGI